MQWLLNFLMPDFLYARLIQPMEPTDSLSYEVLMEGYEERKETE